MVHKPASEVSFQELNSHLAEKFAKWQLPDDYRFLKEIPRTSTGKFWKAKLRELYSAGSL